MTTEFDGKALPVEYVAIVRHVMSLDDDNPTAGLSSAATRLFGWRLERNQRTLRSYVDTLGKRGALVLIAPSGSGKTTELKQLSQRLRAEGQHAVFAEATGLAAPQGVELDNDERLALERMVERQSGVLVVDGVDELRLQHASLPTLFRRLRQAVDFSSCEVRLVFSARNGAWSNLASQQLANQLKTLSADEPLRVRFDKLSPEAIRALARAYGAVDVEAFMSEFEDGEFDDLIADLRPVDIKRLVALRQTSGSLGNWSRVARDHVESVFLEEEPLRNWTRSVPLASARAGLQRVAAAALLCRVPLLSLPTSGAGEAVLSSRKLFADWPAAHVSELFESPMFVHKGRTGEAVQLPQGRISHFLAGEWLAERAANGLDADLVRRCLMVQLPWTQAFHIPTTTQAVVGWVASAVPSFRRLLVRDHPAVILYEGDPENLSDAEIREVLPHFCQQVAAGAWDGWATPATIRRLARPSLEPQVKALLQTHPSRPRVLMQLLKWVELGRYSDCGDVALDCAIRSDDALARMLAIRAVAAAAPALRHRLLELTSEADPYVRQALLTSLVPDVLWGEALVRFLLDVLDEKVALGLSEIQDKVAVADLDALLVRLLPLLADPNVTEMTANAFHLAVAAAIARLRRDVPYESDFPELLLAIERLRHDHTQMNLSDAEERALSDLVANNASLRRQLWELRFREVNRSADAYHHTEHPAFGQLNTSDIEWLWLRAQGQDTTNRYRVHAVMEWLWLSTSSEQQTVLASGLALELREHLTQLARRRADLEKGRVVAAQAETRKDEATRAKNRGIISTKLTEIESGSDVQALLWAWRQLVGNGSDRQRVNLARLRKYVGDDYADTFVRGMRRCWRTLDVAIPEPGKGNNVAALGLTGLALDIQAGLDVKSLSVGDAARAARLAMHELNAFPFWFADLTKAHGAVVRSALHEVIATEWQNAEQDLGQVLRFGAYSEPEVSDLMRSVVLDLGAASAPAHASTIHVAVDCLLTSTQERPRVLAILRREVARVASPDANWLRLWAHLDPERAADWFERRREDADGRAKLITTASLLEQDLNERTGPPVSTAIMAPSALRRWSRLLLDVFPSAEDVEHKGAYHPGEHDYGRDLRRRCLSRLAENPTVEARAVLLELRADERLKSERETFDWLISNQTQAAIEAATATWTEEDILAFERGDEKKPRSLLELFDLVRGHLRHVDALVSNDNFSYRSLFSSKTKEREIQLWVASCLRERARGLYSVVRENVEDDDKEVDISAFAAGVGHVPIEIKPLGDYSVAALEQVITTQLIGKYMLPPDQTHGVLLLVRLKAKVWRHNGDQLRFQGVLNHLNAFAKSVGNRLGKDIHVGFVDVVPQVAAEQASHKALPPIGRKRIQKAKGNLKSKTQTNAKVKTKKQVRVNTKAGTRARAGGRPRVRR